MPGPAQPWDQPEDPRDQTVDLPRIDLASFGNGHPAPENGSRPSRYQADQSRTLPPRPGPPPPAGPPADRPVPGPLPRRGSGAGPEQGSQLTPLPPYEPGLPPQPRLPPEPLPRRRPEASRDPYARPADDGREPGSLFRPAPPADGSRRPVREGGERESGSRDTGFRGSGSRDDGSRRSGSRDDGSRGSSSRDDGYRGSSSRDSGFRGDGPRDDGTLGHRTGRDAPAQPAITSQLPAFTPPPGGMAAARPDLQATASTSVPAEQTRPPLLAEPIRPAGPAEPPSSVPPASSASLATGGLPAMGAQPATTAPPATSARPARSEGPLSADSPADMSTSPGPYADSDARDLTSAQLAPVAAEPSADRAQPPDGSAVSGPPARRRTARPGSAGRPAAGSTRDLLARLDRLPDGHPSSPYEDGGLAKPLPQRLRQLELGLPAPERELAEASPAPDFTSPTADFSGRAANLTSPAADLSRPAPDLTGPAAGDEDPATPGASSKAESAGRSASPERESGAGSERPARRSADPGPTGDPEGASAPRQDRPTTPGDGPRHDRSWQDPYARPAQTNGHGRSEPRPAGPGLSLGPWPGAGHEASLAADLHNGADSPEPPGPPPVPSGWPGDDQADLVAGMLAAYRAAEGRNSLGEYGQSGLTPALRRIASQLPRGGLAPGAEALKSPARMAAKLGRLIARHPGRSAEELAAGIGDGVRYAFTFDPDYYTEGTWLVHRKLKAYGFELEARRNRWDSPEYKGVWTRWHDPAHGIAFEVQFHTGVSWDVVQRTHEAFIQITDPATSSAERARLRARQVAAAATTTAPPNCAEISDFGREVR